MFLIILNLAATILIISVCCYLWFIRRLRMFVAIFIFYILTVFGNLFPFSLAYYIKWGIYCFLIISWTFITFTMRHARHYTLYKIPIYFAILFIFSALLSAVFSGNLGQPSLRALLFLLLVSVSFIFMSADDPQKEVKEVFLSFLVFDSIIIMVSACGLFWPGLYEQGRFGGIFVPYSNTMGLFAYSCLISCTALLIWGNEHRGRYIIIAGISMIVLFLTKSRASLGVALAGIMIICSFLSKSMVIVLTFILALATIFIISFYSISWEGWSASLLRGTTAEEIGGPRIFYIQRAIKTFKENPLFGIGMGNAPKGIKQEIADPDNPFRYDKTAAEVGYFGLLAETGIIGSMFYFGWLLSSLYAGFKVNRDYLHSQEIFLYWTAFLGLFVAYALHGLFEAFPLGAANIVSVRMWALSGLFALYGGNRAKVPKVGPLKPFTMPPSEGQDKASSR